jgi:hypothetical protein
LLLKLSKFFKPFAMADFSVFLIRLFFSGMAVG